MVNQGKLLTKFNPRYVRVFKSLPWLVNRNLCLQIIKYQNIFLSQYYVQKYLVCNEPYIQPESKQRSDLSQIRPCQIFTQMLVGGRSISLQMTGCRLQPDLSEGKIKKFNWKDRLVEEGLIEISNWLVFPDYLASKALSLNWKQYFLRLRIGTECVTDFD
jgi:hypothetical protein